ncbi:hypothetical protein FVE85_9054 [Porphyridium purpureum]|uniref:tRNA-splicing endonuclease subunit Sen54 N-terminal domain-containing protein n=1 Tax=Porphyridium purpureum TaxID=35688 RepID=A0A5J4YPJ0_PORPP|nr:hypothetical protein FVE85_9054 [Porphyridium purpureum]|eukprot:POR1298..scf222_8
MSGNVAGGKPQLDWWRKKKLPARGTKECVASPADAAFDAGVVRGRREAIHKVVGVRKPSKPNSLSIGEWHACVQRVRIVCSRGKWLMSMGFERGQISWLNVEEAIFLLEAGGLYLKSVPCTVRRTAEECENIHHTVPHSTNDRDQLQLPWCQQNASPSALPMSLQRAHATMVSSEKQLRIIYATGHLRRIGYIVRRPRMVDEVHTLGAPHIELSVWQHASFRGKRLAGKPDFHLIVLSNLEVEALSMTSVLLAAEKCAPVGLKLCVVERASVLIYDLVGGSPTSGATPLVRIIGDADQPLLQQYAVDRIRVIDESDLPRIEANSDEEDELAAGEEGSVPV